MENTIYVYENFSQKEALLIGYLYVNNTRGNEYHSFEFDNTWLSKHNNKFLLDPELLPIQGRQYPDSNKTTFGMFSDSSPDCWGRILMERREHFLADKEKRKPNKLNTIDYLLGVYDENRMGATRFKTNKNGPFLSSDKETAVPPWATLRSLEEASRNYENEDNILEKKWLNQLIRPGSSLGGARPKATVKAPDDSLWIAKFPSRKDDYNTGAWEKTAQDLAGLCGLKVTETRLETFSKLGSTFLIKRFDRDKGQRIHFSSAMTMLNKIDGDNDSSYLDIVSFLKANGSLPNEDIVELWKRIVFSMAISNTDDHLRNHGFVLEKNGWRLAPLYDVNPCPYGNTLSLNINEYDNRISLDLAIDSAIYYGLNKKEAKEIAYKIIDIVRNNFEKLALNNGLSHSSIEYMRPAFSLCFNPLGKQSK